jgi:hypothetical protein
MRLVAASIPSYLLSALNGSLQKFSFFCCSSEVLNSEMRIAHRGMSYSHTGASKDAVLHNSSGLLIYAAPSVAAPSGQCLGKSIANESGWRSSECDDKRRAQLAQQSSKELQTRAH